MTREDIGQACGEIVGKVRGDYLLDLPGDKHEKLHSLREMRRELIERLFTLARMVDVQLHVIDTNIATLEQGPMTPEKKLQIAGLKIDRLEQFRTSYVVQEDLAVLFAKFAELEEKAGIHEEVTAPKAA